MSIRVFLVEEMQPVHGVLAELLAELASIGDFRIVASVRTEAEAKLWLSENPGGWDLAVLDLVLEQGTGMGVIGTARQGAERDGGSVVVYSDYASDGIQRHCRNLGADAVFSKTDGMQDFIDFCAELGGGVAPSP